MSLSFFASLRPRLMLLAFLVILPFIALTLFTFAERRQYALADRLAVGVPPEVAAAEANNLLLSSLVILVVTCLLTFGIAWIGSDLLVRRYRQSLSMVGVTQDITERKQVEGALRDSEQRYRFITELISDFAFSYRVESDGTIHNEWFTDDSYRRVTGYTPAEIGTTFKLFHPEDETRARRDVEATIGGKSSSAEYRILTRGGELRWLHISRRSIWNAEQQRVVRYIGVAQDITERKLTEETLQRYTVELEQRVAERTAELQTALHQEKQVNELKSRFSSMVTHEFRNPLAAIHLSSDVLKKYHLKLTDDKRLEHIERIQARVKFLSELLDDILTISKAETVGLDFNPVPLDLDALCRAVIEDTPPTREDAPQVIYASDGSTNITGDEKLLRQMFGNLLSNAVKYSLNGGPVQVDLHCREGDVLLRIADQGIGIPEADLKRLGDSFHRASNTQGIPGTGLGVAIARRAAEAHGGSIAVESAVGVGSTFTVRLPLKN